MAARKPPQQKALVYVEDVRNCGIYVGVCRNRAAALAYAEEIFGKDDPADLSQFNIDIEDPSSVVVTIYTVTSEEIFDVVLAGVQLIPRKK